MPIFISNKLEIVIPLFQPNSSRLNRISSFKKSGTYLERDKKNLRRMAQCLRLICFLTIVVLVFVDIYCTFRYVNVKISYSRISHNMSGRPVFAVRTRCCKVLGHTSVLVSFLKAKSTVIYTF